MAVFVASKRSEETERKKDRKGFGRSQCARAVVVVVLDVVVLRVALVYLEAWRRVGGLEMHAC